MDNVLKCSESGDTPGESGEWTRRRGPRYVYVSTDDTGAACYYWSRVPGGLDSWNPVNDPAVIAANTLPLCPVDITAVVDVPATAWSIFRTWELDAPDISLQPSERGITGLPTFLASPAPAEIVYSEALPDGRVLEVRAGVTELRVDWGDGTRLSYGTEDALAYPEGSVTHTYTTKTCPPDYRQNHPSGGLCHPTLEYYTIGATYRWAAEYNVGAGWVQLGTLDRSASLPYDVDEVRGVPVPTP